MKAKINMPNGNIVEFELESSEVPSFLGAFGGIAPEKTSEVTVGTRKYVHSRAYLKKALGVPKVDVNWRNLKRRKLSKKVARGFKMWTPDEDNRLVAMYRPGNTRACAQLLNRTTHATACRINILRNKGVNLPRRGGRLAEQKRLAKFKPDSVNIDSNLR